MIQIVKEPESNLINSASYGNREMARSSLLNAVADLIIFDREEVLRLLNNPKVNIKAKKNERDAKLAEKIISNLNDNAMLRQGLSFLIAKNTGLLDSENNVNGERSSNIAGDPVSAVANAVSSISKNISNKQDQKYQQKQNQAELAKMILEKRSVTNTPPPKQSNTGLYVFLAIAGVLVLAGGFYYFKYMRGGAMVSAQAPPPMA